MKAVRYHEYGGTDVLRHDDVERPVPGAGHHRVARELLGRNDPEPAAPIGGLGLCWRWGGCAWSRARCGRRRCIERLDIALRQVAGHGMRKASLGDQRLIGLRHHIAGRLGRQHGRQRRPVDARIVGEFRPRRQKQRTAILDVFRNILEIG